MGVPRSVIKMKWVCLHNLGIQGKNDIILCNFPQRVEIEQKSTAHLGLGLLQPLMQKWRWIPSDQKAQKCSPLTIFSLLGMESITTVFLICELQQLALVLLFLRSSTDQTSSLLLLIEYTRKEKCPFCAFNWNENLDQTGVCPCLF